MTGRRLRCGPEIPLSVWPPEIAKMVQEQGWTVCRIGMKRMRPHHYNVTVRTKSVARELEVREYDWQEDEPGFGDAEPDYDNGAGGASGDAE